MSLGGKVMKLPVRALVGALVVAVTVAACGSSGGKTTSGASSTTAASKAPTGEPIVIASTTSDTGGPPPIFTQTGGSLAFITFTVIGLPANGAGTKNHYVTRGVSNGFSETQTISCTDVSASSNTTASWLRLPISIPTKCTGPSPRLSSGPARAVLGTRPESP